MASFFHTWLSVLLILFRSCCGFGKYKFDIYHRFSDPVKAIFPVKLLPDMGSRNYFSIMAQRDHLIHSQRVASAANNNNNYNNNNPAPLTFSDGNETYRISYFAYLYYANVSVGTPSEIINFNIYSPKTSSTARNVTCKSPKCSRKSECHSAESACPYEVKYLSNGTSSSGVLVEDTLHLTTDTTTRREPVNVPITFGCGQVLTGAIFERGAPNGLLGLGMSNESVPTTLAREGYISDSFSMCFGPNDTGRISFGDTGSLDQKETPLNPHLSYYNISITSVQVAGNSVELEFHAIFDSGTSMTMLIDPAYTLITQAFDKQAKEKRSTSSAGLPFEYCYETWSFQNVNLVMKGGSIFKVTEPISVEFSLGHAPVYCLGVKKSKHDNIIGQNFMTSYNIVFNRERNVLGWKESNCFDDELLNSATNLLLPLHAITLLFLALLNILFYFDKVESYIEGAQ